jgi:hypothetical protein
LEALESRRLMATTPTPLSVYLTGNSLTDGTRYKGLAAMLATAGRPVALGRQTGSGFSQADNLYLHKGYITSGVMTSDPSRVDPFGNYVNAFANFKWDALTLQPNDRHLFTDINKNAPAAEQNEAEIPMSLAFMKKLAKNSPDAQVFIYSRPARRTDVNIAGDVVTGKTFDYSAEWSKTYVDTSDANVLTRSYVEQLMTGLRKAQSANATTKAMRPVRLIPVGEAYYNVDQMIKAGKFNDTYVKSIFDFYVDGSHPRGDTGSYLIALTFYAALTGRDPRGVAPNDSYLNPPPGKLAARVQRLIQDAVYEAMTYTGYTGWTTPMPAAPPPPPPPTPTPTPTGRGSIRVSVFADADRDGIKDLSEPILRGVVAFIDANNNGVLDAGEKSGTSNSKGRVTFENLAVGSYVVRFVPMTNTRATTANPQYFRVKANVTRVVHAGLTYWRPAARMATAAPFSDAAVA